jgi:hypothetical protein
MSGQESERQLNYLQVGVMWEEKEQKQPNGEQVGEKGTKTTKKCLAEAQETIHEMG